MKAKLLENESSPYCQARSKCNGTQIMTVRCLFRKNGYLNKPECCQELTDVERKVEVLGDLLCLDEISKNNLADYMEAREKQESVKLSLAYVTIEEKRKGENLINKSIDELKTLIFQKICELPTEKHELYEEIYVKSVKNKQKC